MTTIRRTLAVAALLAGVSALALGCSSDGDDAPTTTTGAPTTTSSAPVSTSVPTDTTEGGSTSSSSPANTLPVLVPGQACAPGSDPDCIDPEGLGEYVYLIGGADCMASPIGGPSCTDLDGDGYAGYPDRG